MDSNAIWIEEFPKAISKNNGRYVKRLSLDNSLY